MARAPKDDEAVAYMEFGKAGQALFVQTPGSATSA